MKRSFSLNTLSLEFIFIFICFFPVACTNPTSPVSPDAQVTTLAGGGAGIRICGSTNATGTEASFCFPLGVAVDSSGNVYVSDYSNVLIRKITSRGIVSTLAANIQAEGLAADGSGNVYVADSENNVILKISTGGVVSTVAGSGSVGSLNATGTAASFNNPWGVAVDSSDNVYVADAGNNLIRKISAGGVVSTLAGSGSYGFSNGAVTTAMFETPDGVAVDSSGNVYVADYGNSVIRKITSGGMVTTLAGQVGVHGSANGPATIASFDVPYGVAVDASWNVYVVDTFNDLIRKITPEGMVTTLAGKDGVMGSANGPAASATFDLPEGIAVDSSRNVYVADFDNDLIRKILMYPPR
jgi:hypothetical protein